MKETSSNGETSGVPQESAIDPRITPGNGGTDGAWPWMVCTILLIATMLNYMDRQALAVTLPTLKKSMFVTETRYGLIEKYFSYSFAAGGLIFGWLADRYGPRLLYPLVLAGWSLAGIATSMSGQEWVTSLFQSPSEEPGTGTFRWLVMCRSVLGLCEAGHWPCALLTVRAVLQPAQLTLGNGILQSGASIGAVLIPLYIEAAERAGKTWEFSFWSIGLAGFLWIPVWFFLIGNRQLRAPVRSSSSENTSLSADSRSDFVRKLVTLAIIVTTLTISWQFLRAWLALFLQDHHKYSELATRGAMSGYFIASDVGCFLSGVLVARLVSRGMSVHGARSTGFLIFVLLTASGALIPFAGNGKLMMSLLYITGAGILGLHPFYYSLIQDLSAKHMGTFSGLLAAIGWIVTGQFQQHIGKFIQTNKSYDMGLTIVAFAPALGLLVLLLLWPSRSRQQTVLPAAAE